MMAVGRMIAMHHQSERELVRIRYALRELTQTRDPSAAAALITWLERLGEQDVAARPSIHGEAERWRSVFDLR
jgi:hypothetical protein